MGEELADDTKALQAHAQPLQLDFIKITRPMSQALRDRSSLPSVYLNKISFAQILADCLIRLPAVKIFSHIDINTLLARRPDGDSALELLFTSLHENAQRLGFTGSPGKNNDVVRHGNLFTILNVLDYLADKNIEIKSSVWQEIIQNPKTLITPNQMLLLEQSKYWQKNPTHWQVLNATPHITQSLKNNSEVKIFLPHNRYGDKFMEAYFGGAGWGGETLSGLDFRIIKDEDYKLLNRVYLETQDANVQNAQAPEGYQEIIYHLLKTEGTRAFALGLKTEYLLLGQSKGQGLKGEFWRAQEMRASVSPIMYFFEQGRLSASNAVRKEHATIGAEILTYLAKNNRKLPDNLIIELGVRLPPGMKSILQDSPYFEEAKQIELFLAGNERGKKPVITPLKDAPLLEGADRIAALVDICLESNTLAPLQDALKTMAQAGDYAVVDATMHTAQAFDLLPKSFYAVRDMVNALKPGSYALALKKPEAPKNFIERFKAAVFPPKHEAPAQKPASQLYKESVDNLTENIALFNRAEDILFSLSRSSFERQQDISLFANDIRSYLERADGEALAQESPMLFDKLQSAVMLLEHSTQTLEVSAGLLGSFSERINIVSQSVSQSLLGTNLAMVVHIGETIIKDESNRLLFDGALDKMLDMARWVSANYTVNATSFDGQAGAKLLEQAQNLQEDIKELKHSIRPNETLGTPPAPQ